MLTVRNRSNVNVKYHNNKFRLKLLPNCLESIRKASKKVKTPIEVILADWVSTDWPLKEWVGAVLDPIPVKVIDIDREGFSRGYGLNIAYKYANGNILFFTDSDMLISAETLNHGIKWATKKGVYYPICQYPQDPEWIDVKWTGGRGNVFLTRKLFELVDGWPEYWTFGYEDHDMCWKLLDHTCPIQERVQTFIHQWHPIVRTWKDRYASNIEDIHDMKKRQKLYHIRRAEIVAKMEILNPEEYIIHNGKVYYDSIKIDKKSK